MEQMLERKLAGETEVLGGDLLEYHFVDVMIRREIASMVFSSK
jgi:hypothetical protein